MKFGTLGVVIIILLIVGFANRDFVTGWLSHITPAPTNSVRGEWVGKLQIYGIHDPYARDVQLDAVIRLKLVMTDSFLKDYGGSGEITIAGQTPQPFTLEAFQPDAQGDSFTYRTGMSLKNYGVGDRKDFISGEYQGSFAPGSLEIHREEDLGYRMKGELHKGTDADYRALAEQLSTKNDTRR